MTTDVNEHEATVSRRLASPSRGYIGRVSAALNEIAIKAGERARLTVIGHAHLKISRETQTAVPRHERPPKTQTRDVGTPENPGKTGKLTMLSIAKEFSNTPGPRYKKQGPDSGEAFRDMLLEPAITEAETNGAPLTVDLDGSRYGYPVGWLEEVFGGLIRKHGRERFDRIHLTGSDHGSRQAIEEIRNLTDERTAGPANEGPETTPTRNNAQ